MQQAKDRHSTSLSHAHTMSKHNRHKWQWISHKGEQTRSPNEQVVLPMVLDRHVMSLWIVSRSITAGKALMAMSIQLLIC